MRPDVERCEKITMNEEAIDERADFLFHAPTNVLDDIPLVA